MASSFSCSFSRDARSQEKNTCLCFPLAFLLLLRLLRLLREARCCEKAFLNLRKGVWENVLMISNKEPRQNQTSLTYFVHFYIRITEDTLLGDTLKLRYFQGNERNSSRI